jgi:hypothetical protein
VKLDLDVRFSTPRMKIALVGGVHRSENDRRWTLVASNGLVQGPWGRPEPVTPMWVIEGPNRPVRVDYYLE